MDIFSKNTINFIQLRWYQLTLWLMEYFSVSRYLSLEFSCKAKSVHVHTEFRLQQVIIRRQYILLQTFSAGTL